MLLMVPGTVLAAFPTPPPLPAPSGRVVKVSTEPQLQAAVSSLTSDTTILIAPGTYQLTSTLYLNGNLQDVALRGASGNRDDVVLVGRGMINANHGDVPHGIWTGNGVRNVLIANLTVRDVYTHCLILNAGTQAPRLYNVRFSNAGEQIVKGNPDGAGGGVDDGVVEYSIFEFETTSRNYYTNGVDILTGRRWQIRNNLFLNIRAPQGELAGPAVLMWRNAADTITEGNTFIDCQRAIAYGLDDANGNDHAGGIIRNNFIYRGSGQAGDAGIIVFASPNTVVANNTILLSGTYPNAIEYRFAATTNVTITNNLTDAAIRLRDGATASVSSNYTQATPALFVSAVNGDLHLVSTATVAINAGTPVAAVTVDWDGEPRPSGPGPDLGADEFNGAAPQPPMNLRIVR